MRRQRPTRIETPPRMPRSATGLQTLTLALLLAAIVPLTSCAVLSPPTPRSGGDRLSDAAKETRKKPDQQSTLVAGDRKHECDDGDVAIAIDVNDDRDDRARRADRHSFAEPERHRERRVALSGGLIAGAGTVRDGDFAPSTLYGMRVGIAPASRTRVDLALLGGPSRFAPGSDVEALLRNPWELAGDLSVRYSLTPDHAAIGVAPIVGMRVGTLFWRYRNGITLDQDGEVRTVNHDWIDHYTPYAGVAVAFLRTPHVEVGAEALTGWRFYDHHTNAGLENDLFGDTRFREFRIAATVPF